MHDPRGCVKQFWNTQGTRCSRMLDSLRLRRLAFVSPQEDAERLGGVFVRLLDELRVDVLGRGGVGVAEPTADCAYVDSERQELRGAEVAEVVQLDALEA